MSYIAFVTPNAQLRTAVRGFYAWIASMIVLAVSPIAALQLSERPSTAARLAGVLLGAGGMVPWLWVVYSIIRRGDEFVRRLHLVALSFAFGGTLLLLVALEWMTRAHFIDRPDLIIVMFGAIVIWFTALMGAKFYFGRER